MSRIYGRAAWILDDRRKQSFLVTVLRLSVVRYPRYLDTYRRYLRDDTSIANFTLYRGIS